MIHRTWVHENRKNLICVDSYEDGVLKGRFFDAYREMESFGSLSQFLIRMEQILEDRQEPQSYTQARTFSQLLHSDGKDGSLSRIRRGSRATFELQILFRQHASWQGNLIWRETGMEHSFRSVLELVMLLDSALRSPESLGVA